jgi:RHS repeat-associated protein
LRWGTPFGFRPSISESLSYDPAGNILRQVRELGTFNYSYDAADQLLGVDFKKTRGAWECSDDFENKLKESWQLDLVGNHTQDSRLGATTFLANQILQDDKNDYFPDSQGMGRLAMKVNRVTGRSTAYSYRPDGKLVGLQRTLGSSNAAQAGPADQGNEDEDAVADSPQFQAQYRFDAFGRRLSKKIIRMNGSGFIQSYLYLGDRDQILLGQSGDGKQSLYLDDLGLDVGVDSHLGEISKRDGSKIYAVDHLGSVLNGEAGGEDRVFSAYGRGVSTRVTLSASSPPTVYGFAGRQLDRESGLYYNRARIYSQQTGRFLSQDPLFPGSGLNAYESFANNPLIYTDPSGLVAFLYNTPTQAGAAGFVIGAALVVGGAVAGPVAVIGGAGAALGAGIGATVNYFSNSGPVQQGFDATTGAIVGAGSVALGGLAINGIAGAAVIGNGLLLGGGVVGGISGIAASLPAEAIGQLFGSIPPNSSPLAHNLPNSCGR